MWYCVILISRVSLVSVIRNRLFCFFSRNNSRKCICCLMYRNENTARRRKTDNTMAKQKKRKQWSTKYDTENLGLSNTSIIENGVKSSAPEGTLWNLVVSQSQRYYFVLAEYSSYPGNIIQQVLPKYNIFRIIRWNELTEFTFSGISSLYNLT